jgi:hypothetical protein
LPSRTRRPVAPREFTVSSAGFWSQFLYSERFSRTIRICATRRARCARAC